MSTASVRLLGLGALIALAAACGRRTPEQQIWDHQMDGQSASLRVFATSALDGDWVTSGELTARTAETSELVWEKECKKSGTAREYADGTLVFDECVVDRQTRLHGTIRMDDDNFVYDNMEFGFDDPPNRVDGGYTWSGNTLVQDQTFSGRDHTGNDGDWTTKASAVLTIDTDANTVSGAISMTTTTQFGTTQETECAFEDAPFGDWTDLLDPKEKERILNRMCPQWWDEEVTVEFHLYHRNDGDPDPIHIVLPGQTMDDSKKIRPRGHSRVTKTFQRGEPIWPSAGRGGTVFGATSCPPATDLEPIDIAYDDGLGLNPFYLYCVFHGEIPPSPGAG